jgi:hypothetical protein
MAGILDYVRPVWADHLPRRVERGLSAMVSETAAAADPALARVRRSCAAVRVLPLHPGLGARRDACVGLLDTYRGFLRRVAADGRRGAGTWPEDTRSRC